MTGHFTPNIEQIFTLFERWAELAPAECLKTKSPLSDGYINYEIRLYGFRFHTGFIDSYNEHIYLMWVEEAVIIAIEQRGWDWSIVRHENKYAACVGTIDDKIFASVEGKDGTAEAILTAYLLALEGE